jgi:hypothetical protein
MTDTIYNTCVICGKETNMRCQPCGKAGVEVYFCGAEYQRAVRRAFLVALNGLA